MMWSAVELREIRVFLTLAEEMHFGRTAQRLHLTPSRVSQILRELEAKLGAQLVHRTSRRVELTAPGERLRDAVGGAHEQLMSALEESSGQVGAESTIRLALLANAMAGPQLPAIASAFQRRNPTCRIEVSRAPYGDAFGCLSRGDIDLLVTWLPHGRPDLVVGPTLVREQRVLAVAQDHPFASRAGVSVEDIADYRVVPIEEVWPRELAEAWIPRKTPSGRLIRRLDVPFGQMAQSNAAQLRPQMDWWISSGEIVHPTVPSGHARLSPDLVYVPITDMPPLRRVLVRRRRMPVPAARDFIRVAQEVLRAEKQRAAKVSRGTEVRPRHPSRRHSAGMSLVGECASSTACAPGCHRGCAGRSERYGDA